MKSLEFWVASYGGGRDISGEWLQQSIMIIYDDEQRERNLTESLFRVVFSWYFRVVFSRYFRGIFVVFFVVFSRYFRGFFFFWYFRVVFSLTS